MVDFDVLIVGGGLVGCTFALDLARQKPGFKIAVLEHSRYMVPDFNTLDSKIYAISPRNVNYLAGLGAWPDASRIGTIKTMDVSGDAGGNILLEDKLAKSLFLAKTIEYKYLQHQLYQQLQQMTNIEFIYDELNTLNNSPDWVKLSGNKSDYTTRLVVGADGANSFIRVKAGIEFSLIDYEQSGIVANFSCEFGHQNRAYQWFKQGSILAWLPLPGKQISIVWATNQFKQLLELSGDDFCAATAKFGEYKLGQLQLITQPKAFPLRLYLLDKVYADNKAVLIGDAAHTIHPLAGQGVNLGFGDSKLLAQVLAACQPYQLGDKSLLAKYSALRLGNVRQMQLTCHWLERLFKLSDSLSGRIRNHGLNLVNSMPLLKKYLIKKALAY